MKYLLVLLFPSVCFAKTYHFVFKTETRDKLEFKTNANSWEEAYTRAADFCTDFMLKKGEMNEERILYITDVCGNPGEK